MKFLRAYRSKRESGFTLVELLVVIIIIGILAAIAIPVFLNQRQRANDATTISNVKAVVNSLQEGLVAYPDANYIVLFDNDGQPPPTLFASTNIEDANGDGKVTIMVGNDPTDSYTTEIPINEGVVLNLHTTTLPPGEFRLRGWNPAGKRYVDTPTGYLYMTTAGGYVNNG